MSNILDFSSPIKQIAKMSNILDFLSTIEQIAKINSIISNKKNLTKQGFDYKKGYNRESSKIKLLKACRIEIIRKNRKVVDSLYTLFILIRACLQDN